MRDLRVKCLDCGLVLVNNRADYDDEWAAACPRCGGLYATYFVKL